MAMDTWGGTEARQLSVTVNPSGEVEQWNSSEGWNENWAPKAALLQVMTEWLVRWPCPASHDEEHYVRRMCLLIWDCRDLQPALLRKAGDYVARIPNRPTVMPSASEIMGAVEQLMAARAAKQAAAMRQEAQERGQPMPAIGDKAAAYHRANLRHMEATGGRVMQTDDGELFKLGDRGERRGIRPDGSAIVPFFHHRKDASDTIPQGWYCRQEDVAALSECYRRYGAEFILRGAMVVRVEA